jgi:chloramphenicol 3-O-phosphotransferase
MYAPGMDYTSRGAAQVDCSRWLRGVHHDGDALFGIMSIIAAMHDHDDLSADDVLWQLRNLGDSLIELAGLHVTAVCMRHVLIDMASRHDLLSQ